MMIGLHRHVLKRPSGLACNFATFASKLCSSDSANLGHAWNADSHMGSA